MTAPNRLRTLLAATLLVTSLGVSLPSAVLATTSVVSAGSVPPGGTSVGSASFTFTENGPAQFPPGAGTLVVTILDSGSAATVHFVGTPVVTAPGSLAATASVAAGGGSFTLNFGGSDTLNPEQATVSGLRISADAGAAAGAIKATLGGSLVGAVTGGTVTASGSLLTAVTTSTTAATVAVSSACGFASTGGPNGNVNFSDIVDPRTVGAVGGVVSGQQSVTINAGGASHPIATTVTQSVADCQGLNLGSPGTVGGVPVSTDHLAFVVQPGGGAAGAVWAQQPAVAVQNTLNQTLTTDNTTIVTLTIGTNPAAGVLSCTSGTSRQVIAGVASFAGCSINVASASPYTLVATSTPAKTPATSSAFIIGAVSDHLAFAIQPGGGNAGVPWVQQPVVVVQNALNQTVTTDNATVVTVSTGVNPAGGILTCAGGNSRQVINGVATFSGCSISLGSTTAYTLVATSVPVKTPATSGPFLIAVNIQSVTLTDFIAPGVNHGTVGFGTSSLVVVANSYITILGTSNPSLANATIQVWTRTKTGPWTLRTTRIAAADGTVHYFARVNGWTAYQLRFAGNGTFGPAASHGRIATNR